MGGRWKRRELDTSSLELKKEGRPWSTWMVEEGPGPEAETSMLRSFAAL